MDGGDGALPDQPLQSEGLKDKHSENVCKDGMEDAVTDKDTEDPFESQGDVGVHKGDGAELNADLSDSEVSESLLCDGVINMLRKILDTKQTREIVRNETLKRQRNNESQDNCAPPKAYSRCSVPYFLEVVKATCKSEKKVELVRSIGFPYLLELDDSVVPRSFAQWVADKVRVEDELIIIHDKKIPLNAESVFHVFGIPAGETIINTTDDGGKEEFLALFGLPEVPTIKYFGNKIIKEEELSDDQYIRCFMVVALATFLCPTSNTKPSTKYMGALLDVSKIKELNWCKFTHTWLIQAINKYQKEKMKPNKTTLTLGGCIYHLVVRCLDFIDFGPIQLQSTMPRICVWKGNLIKLFSEALLDKNGAYRACKIKNESETCYGLENHGWASTERHSYLKAAIEKAVGDAVNEKAKEDIYLSFQHYMKDEGPNTCSKVKQLILQVLQIVTIAACASEKTVRIESSSNQQNSTNVKHDSEATVKGSPSHTIVGRRLFHDEESHVHILDGTKQNPITFRDSQPASPEVQFLGERSLQEKCLNMLGNSDEHYNTRLFLGSTNSSVGKENIPPKRIVQPSRFRCSPYDDQDRGSLMSHEVELYSNIMILSRDPDFKGKWVVEIDNCRVSMEQLGNSFRDKGWVESYVINVFCRKLFRDNHPRVSQRHFFFHTASEYFLQKWKNEQARLMWKDKLIKSFIGAGKAKDLQLCNELFFPTLHENHWFVFLVDLCARKFIFLDSKYDEDSPYHRSIKHMLIENFKQAWNDAGLRNMGFRHYETAYPNLPKQDGCDACGIFVLKWLENWRSRNVLQTVFKQDNVKDARIRLAVDILFSKHNILEEGKRVVKNL